MLVLYVSLFLLCQHTSPTVSRKHASHLKDGWSLSLTKEPVHTSYPFHQFIFTSRRTWEKLLGQNGSRRMLKTPDWRTSLVVQRVKTTFQCRGCGFNPWSGSSDPHASQWETKAKNRSNVVTNSIKTLRMLHIKKKKILKEKITLDLGVVLGTSVDTCGPQARWWLLLMLCPRGELLPCCEISWCNRRSLMKGSWGQWHKGVSRGKEAMKLEVGKSKQNYRQLILLREHKDIVISPGISVALTQWLEAT